MYCDQCGVENSDKAKFCKGCGKQFTFAPGVNPAPATAGAVEQGRGATILVLGILSLFLLGPILGITAWVMGNRDLKKIGAGKIPQKERGTTLAGQVIGIIGTFISPITILIAVLLIVGTTIFGVRAINVSQRLDSIDKMGSSTAQEEDLAIYDGVEQIRGQTVDDPPAIFLAAISVGYDKKDLEIAAKLEGHKKVIEDRVTKFISSKRASELTPKHYEQIRLSLLQEINGLVSPSKAKVIILKQFVVQRD